jgi:Rieske Fe-S protein
MEQRLETDDARREFLGQCGSMMRALLIAGTIGPLIQACESTAVTGPPVSGSVDIGVGSLDADGKFLVSDELGPDGMKILVVRKDAATYLAISTKCTHQGCAVGAPQNNSITCPCHGSRFNMEGAVLNGPAASPLRRYMATLDAARTTLTVAW